MVYPCWAAREILADNGYYDEDPFVRGHLADCGYDYDDGYWHAILEEKVKTARKDYPAENIKRGEKYLFVKTKTICDETGSHYWEIARFVLQGDQ